MTRRDISVANNTRVLLFLTSAYTTIFTRKDFLLCWSDLYQDPSTVKDSSFLKNASIVAASLKWSDTVILGCASYFSIPKIHLHDGKEVYNLN